MNLSDRRFRVLLAARLKADDDHLALEVKPDRLLVRRLTGRWTRLQHPSGLPWAHEEPEVLWEWLDIDTAEREMGLA